MSYNFFSVIIPTYNSSLSIVNTLNSLVAQSFSNFEVVIVDDMSDDSEMLKLVLASPDYSSLNLKCHYSKVKLNGAGARNLGIELSEGKYIAFLDSDDLWCSDKLLKVSQVIDDFCDKDIDDFLIYSQTEINIDGKVDRIFPLTPFQPSSESLAEYIFGCHGFVQTSTLVLSRDNAARIKFNPEFNRHQDYDFCIRADFNGLYFHMIDEPLTIYNLSSGTSAKGKGESEAYSLFWLNKMEYWLTRRDIFTYKAFKLSQKIKADGHPVRSLITFAKYFILCSTRTKTAFLNRLLEKIKIKMRKLN